MTVRESEFASHQPSRYTKPQDRAALHQGPLALADSRVLTFAEWCALNGLSRRTGRRIIKSPGGPIVTQLSAQRIGITIGNNAAWQASRARG
jgi:hypothetical protein